MITIAMIMMGVALAVMVAAALVFRGAFYERERGRRSHVAACESRRVADNYHSTGKVFYQKAIEAHEDTKEFWSAATVALLDAKRREARCDKMLEDIMNERNLRTVGAGSAMTWNGRKEAV